MVRWKDHIFVRLLKADSTPILLVEDDNVEYAVALPGEARMLLLFMVSGSLWARTCFLPCLAHSSLTHHGSGTLACGLLHPECFCKEPTQGQYSAGFHGGGGLSIPSD